MTRRKQIAQRRAINRRIAELDAANRCWQCKKALLDGQVQVFGDDRRFCSSDCVELARELAAMRMR